MPAPLPRADAVAPLIPGGPQAHKTFDADLPSRMKGGARRWTSPTPNRCLPPPVAHPGAFITPPIGMTRASARRTVRLVRERARRYPVGENVPEPERRS